MDQSADEPAEAPAVFPLASAAALRLWLISAVVLAMAAATAWSMRAQTPEVRIALPPVEDTATPTAQ